MRTLDPLLPLSDPRMARMAAETVVCCGFNATRAARALRPDLKAHRNFAHRLMREPAVLKEIARIMDKPERNAQKFADMQWSWAEKLDRLLSSPDPVAIDKATLEAGLTAARVLARGYGDKKAPVTNEKPMVIEGLGSDIENLTVEKKVVQ